MPGREKDEIARQFGRLSHAYAESPGHARGSDLELLMALLDPAPGMRVLDVATGAGHTAAAAAARGAHVTAVDLAPEMVERTRELAAQRGLAGLEARVMDAEALDLPDACFDAVTCRIAPHHFPDVRAALREIARVLRPGGRFVLEDSTVPEDPELDAFLNGVEKLRDPTHVRSYTLGQWRAMLGVAGLEVARAEPYRKTHDVDEWIRRAGASAEARAAVEEAFLAASPAARRRFEIVIEGGRPRRFTDDKTLLRAEKRAAGR